MLCCIFLLLIIIWQRYYPQGYYSQGYIIRKATIRKTIQSVAIFSYRHIGVGVGRCFLEGRQ